MSLSGANILGTSPMVKSEARTPIQYTEVVVIGNGPSGICLSYMLSGNWPYYKADEPHPNTYLHARLSDAEGLSIIEQDLDYLSSGLEGRSSMPVGLLFDALTHPEADMGIEHTSALRWSHLPDKHIPHVVLGRKQAGGAWQMMDGEMQTLSLGNWMQLPDLPFKQWLRDYKAKHPQSEHHRTLKQNRASIQDVRRYYEDYVKEKGLQGNFHTCTTVTSVQRVLDVCHSVDDESGEQNPCTNNHQGKHKWEVCGYETITEETGEVTFKDFIYRAPNVVLATGTFDKPNRLRVPGENFPCVLHSFSDLEQQLTSGKLNSKSDPVVIIGAGLSAADAILCCQAYSVPVIHLFRRDVEDPGIIFRKLPKLVYPEYHQVHNMMKSTENIDGYISYPQHQAVEFKEDGKVLIRHTKGGMDTIVQASHVVIQIGSRPNLSFMPKSGSNLGIIPDAPIDSKHNPINVDEYSYQSFHECGLFAMGPLVGDNFVRFLRGGALGITSHLWRKRDNNL